MIEEIRLSYGINKDDIFVKLYEKVNEITRYLNDRPRVVFERKHEKAIEPRYGEPKAAGMDLFATDDVWIEPNDRTIVDTGVALKLPEGWKVEFHSRSGLSAKNGVEVGAGLIDELYNKNLCVILFNHSDERVHIPYGKAITQMKFSRYYQANLVEGIVEDSGRGKFGSTDKV